MKYAVIDIGSNTIRLCVYEVNEAGFKELFHSKIVAGLVSYIENDVLTKAGILKACNSLQEHQKLLSSFDIDEIAVFATASLRNIRNTRTAISEIQEQTGLHIELLSGNEEATMGYYGICREYTLKSGIIVDIGGGSSEVTAFTESGPQIYYSYSLGSLNLFNHCVGKYVLPNDKEQKILKKYIENFFEKNSVKGFPQKLPMYAVGGTARAALKLARQLKQVDGENNILTYDQLKVLRKSLCQRTHQSNSLILKTCPDRVHTIIPGLMILEFLAKKLKTPSICICSNGVREGYLAYHLLNLTGA